jgi:hypothetical protein
VLVVIALASSGIFLLLTSDIEQDLLRRGAARVASFQRLVKRRISEPGVGLALVRGAFAGLVLVWLVLTYFQLSQLAMESAKEAAGQSRSMRILSGLLAIVPTPDPLGFASSSFSPGLFVLASAVFHGLVLGLLAPAYARLDVYGSSRLMPISEWEKRWLSPLSDATVVMIPVVALNLSYPAGYGPGLGLFMAPFILAVPLCWAFRRFDALTLMFAVFTYIVWSQGGPLLVILSEVGNTSVQAAFGVWLAIVLAGAGIGFRQQLTEMVRGMHQPS